ncbi:MAG: AAA family ATPase [Alphaproteobacteria bacterium]|nr:MAG: AAA family ATPase [Alphaproteobacteria bacterium]
MQSALFQSSTDAIKPLAERMRPQSLRDIIGQDHLVADGAPIYQMVQNRTIQSMILWGPPGCGKTTLARILANESGLDFESLSAIFSGVGDLRKIFEGARARAQDGRKTLLFIDEIHRFNKSQQDAFLPLVEDGTITLIGATTENPSFELNAALLSRASVFVLNRLDTSALEGLLKKIEKDNAPPLPLTDDARQSLKAMADGDGRYLLNMVEQIQSLKIKNDLDTEALTKLIQKRAAVYDKGNDSHYNLISALHKSVRGSDPDAALYWFARMLDGGEDPRYLARRITRMAVEDIGLASPQALALCTSAWETYERLGSPEGELAIAQALVFLATAPKSNAAYVAYKKARISAQKYGSLMPPKHILNAPTSMMKDQGYGDGYQYDPDVEGGFSGQNYFPDDMAREQFYAPKGDGFEKGIKDRIDDWNSRRKNI